MPSTIMQQDQLLPFLMTLAPTFAGSNLGDRLAIGATIVWGYDH